MSPGASLLGLRIFRWLRPRQKPGASVVARDRATITVCVPAGWNNSKIKQFADGSRLSGSAAGWTLRAPNGPSDPHRAADRTRCPDSKNVHVTLYAD